MASWLANSLVQMGFSCIAAFCHPRLLALIILEPIIPKIRSPHTHVHTQTHRWSPITAWVWNTASYCTPWSSSTAAPYPCLFNNILQHLLTFSILVSFTSHYLVHATGIHFHFTYLFTCLRDFFGGYWVLCHDVPFSNLLYLVFGEGIKSPSVTCVK